MEVMVSVMIMAVAVSAVVGSIANLHGLRNDTDDVQRAHNVASFMTQSLMGTNWDDLNDQSKPTAYLSWARIPDVDGTGTIDDDSNCLTDRRDAADTNRLPFMTGLNDVRVYLEYYRAVTALPTDGTNIPLSNAGKQCFAGLLQGTLVRTTSPAGEVWNIDPNGGEATRPQEALSGLALGERVGSDLRPRIAPIGIAPLLSGGDPIEPILLPAATAISTLSGVTIGANDPITARIVVSWMDRNLPAPAAGTHAARRQFTVITGLKR